MDEKISRRQMIGSVANAGLVTMMGVGGGSAIASASPVYSDQQQAKVFDVHQHLDPPISPEDYSDIDIPLSEWIEKDHDRRVKVMDDNGIETSVLMPGVKRYRRTEGIESTKKLNDLVAAYVAKYADRFPIGIGTVEPTHGRASLVELERIAKELKFRGVVWHHTESGVPIDHPFMRDIIRKMSELQLIPFIHVTQPPLEDIWSLDRLVQDFPDVTFVALDSMGYTDYNTASVLVLAKRHKNILFDTGPNIGLLREYGVERFVEQVGADRMIFGSDLYAWLHLPTPSFRRNLTLELLNSSHITAEERDKILYGNGRNLFRL